VVFQYASPALIAAPSGSRVGLDANGPYHRPRKSFNDANADDAELAAFSADVCASSAFVVAVLAAVVMPLAAEFTSFFRLFAWLDQVFRSPNVANAFWSKTAGLSAGVGGLKFTVMVIPIPQCR